jgi:hypothetical protein
MFQFIAVAHPFKGEVFFRCGQHPTMSDPPRLVTTELFPTVSRTSLRQTVPAYTVSTAPHTHKGASMNGEFIGLIAVIMSLGIPMAAMYTYFRVRKLRTEERLAAIARGVDVPMVAELPEASRSRRYGILLTSGAVGFIIAMGMIATIERDPETWTAAAVAVIPLAIGIGYFLDSSLIRRDLRSAS